MLTLCLLAIPGWALDLISASHRVVLPAMYASRRAEKRCGRERKRAVECMYTENFLLVIYMYSEVETCKVLGQQKPIPVST